MLATDISEVLTNEIRFFKMYKTLEERKLFYY